MSLQLCLTLWDPMDCSPPGSSVHGILQARTLEWGAMSSSNCICICIYISVCLSFHNKILQIGWFEEEKFISHSSRS